MSGHSGVRWRHQQEKIQVTVRHSLLWVVELGTSLRGYLRDRRKLGTYRSPNWPLACRLAERCEAFCTPKVRTFSRSTSFINPHLLILIQWLKKQESSGVDDERCLILRTQSQRSHPLNRKFSDVDNETTRGLADP
jgi:hypothetical protein